MAGYRLGAGGRSRRVCKSAPYTACSTQATTSTPPKPLSFSKWINSYDAVRHWFSRYDLESMVDAKGGLVRIDNFLPPHVADGMLSVLESIPVTAWRETAAGEDHKANNIAHQFWSTKAAPGLDSILRVFSLGVVGPEGFSTFSAARYDNSHHIAPHDDRAYTDVKLDSGKLLKCSRDLALIYYLTRDWKEGMGGVLIDLEGQQTYVPKYNSLVAFRVPRYHQVTALTSKRARYSIFGWTLQPGIRYPLFTGNTVDHLNSSSAVGPEQSLIAPDPQALETQVPLDGNGCKSDALDQQVEQDGCSQKRKRAVARASQCAQASGTDTKPPTASLTSTMHVEQPGSIAWPTVSGPVADAFKQAGSLASHLMNTPSNSDHLVQTSRGVPSGELLVGVVMLRRGRRKHRTAVV